MIIKEDFQGIHINLNQISTFEMIILNLDHTWNCVYFKNLIPNNQNEFGKVYILNVSKSFGTFFYKFKILPSKNK
jgi:hypothetical protein